IIMFDNQSPQSIHKLSKLVPSYITTEASGGITLDNLKNYNTCGIDYISLGFLIHSDRSLDISLIIYDAYIMVNILDLLKKDNQATIPEHYKNLTEVEMKERVIKIKKELGNKLFIPAHHYQKNEVVEFADTTGDSLQLAQECAKNEEAQFIVFCGVHFMAETADMLTNDEQT